MRRLALVVLLLPLLLPAASPWSRFRGPNGTGVAPGSQPLPVQFGAQQNLAWRTELLPGFSSPVVGDQCIFLTGHEGVKGFTMCVDRNTGAVLWQKQAFELTGKLPSVNTPVSATPVTDGQNVYVFFEAAGLLSYDSTGDLRWKVETGKFNNPYGMSASPILHGDTIVLQADQDTGSYLLAVSAKDGKQIWKTPRPEVQHGFATPVLYTPKGAPAQVILSGSWQVAGYSVATGEKLWWVDGMAWQAKSVPVVDGDRLYVHSWMADLSDILKFPDMTWTEYLEKYDANKDGVIARQEAHDEEMKKLWFLFDLDRTGNLEEVDWKVIRGRNAGKSGLFAIKLGGKGDLTSSAVLWKAEKSLPNIPSPLLYQGTLYVLKEGGILTAYDPSSGAIRKQGRIDGAVDAYFASPIAGDGKVITAGKGGQIAVLKAAPEWEVLQVNDLAEETWATPAIDDGKLYIRTQKALYCFTVKPQA